MLRRRSIRGWTRRTLPEAERRVGSEIFASKVKRGGLIAGDDYASAGWWGDGVRRAVDEFVQSGGCEVVSLDDQFVFKRT